VGDILSSTNPTTVVDFLAKRTMEARAVMNFTSQLPWLSAISSPSVQLQTGTQLGPPPFVRV